MYFVCNVFVYTLLEDIYMGDAVKKKTEKKSLEEKALEREEKKQENVHIENTTIETLSKKGRWKDKAISARVNSTTYANFKKICEARGLSSNACLNMLMTDFVRENKSIIDL